MAMSTSLAGSAAVVTGGGRGLGLAIAREIATACGGLLTVANRQEGGFAVRLELPLQPRNTAHA